MSQHHSGDDSQHDDDKRLFYQSFRSCCRLIRAPCSGASALPQPPCFQTSCPPLQQGQNVRSSDQDQRPSLRLPLNRILLAFSPHSSPFACTLCATERRAVALDVQISPYPTGKLAITTTLNPAHQSGHTFTSFVLFERGADLQIIYSNNYFNSGAFNDCTMYKTL